MVKMIVLSEYSLHSPEDGQGRVKIANGPLYPLERVQKLAAAGGRLNTWTDRCDKTVYELFGGDLDAVPLFWDICALRTTAILSGVPMAVMLG